MIKHDKHYIVYFPEGAQFKIGETYGKIEDGILFRYVMSVHVGCISWKWKSTNKTLEEYNSYYSNEPHEMTLSEIAYAYAHNWCKEGKKLYIYRDFNWRYSLSYNKPVEKGNKGMNRTSGERIRLHEEKYPQIKDFLKDNWFYEFEYKSNVQIED